MIGRGASWLERQAHSYRVKAMRGRYDIDPSFRFEPGSRVYGEGRAVLGAGSYLNTNAAVQTGAGRLVRIGANSRVGPNVRIYTSTTDPDADGSVGPLPQVEGDVTIGAWVWIGHGCYIGPGITIGDNAVVGACSVVNRDVEPYEIVGGVPIRRIRFKTSRPSGPG